MIKHFFSKEVSRSDLSNKKGVFNIIGNKKQNYAE